jgi:AAA family ATP:ADP antiporter
MIFWPVEMHELKKFLPMAFMMFCILFNYTMLRGIKDSLVVSNIAAEVISYLKLWCVTPSAVIFMVIYIHLTNKLQAERIFYIITSSFLVFFALFTYVIYPNPEYFHPSVASIDSMVQSMPSMKWFILLYGKWSYAAFFVMSELWGSAVLTLLFWQFANQITKTSEAKRFYSFFGFFGNFSVIAAGALLEHFATTKTIIDSKAITSNVSNGVDSSILICNSLVIISGLVCMALYKWMNMYVLTDPAQYTPSSASVKKKVKMTLGESFKVIFTSRYLGYIAILVIAYGISINLIEGPWKAKIKELYPLQNDYSAFMGSYLKWVGIISLITMLVGSNILRLCNWLTAAVITPLMIMITGLGFFVLIIFPSELNEYILLFVSASPLLIAVNLGAIQNVLSKATKYSMFDSTKEMSYIPLDDDLKSKGKAAVDVVGGRLGKSGGALIQFVLIQSVQFFANPAPGEAFKMITPVLMVIFLVITGIWILDVYLLNRDYNKALLKREEEAKV